MGTLSILAMVKMLEGWVPLALTSQMSWWEAQLPLPPFLQTSVGLCVSELLSSV